MRRSHLHRLLPALLLGLLGSGSALGSGSGIFRPELTSAGCNGCHLGGLTPTVEVLVGDGDGVAFGATVPVRVRVQALNGDAAGLNLLADRGVLGLRPDQAVQVASSGANAGREATHTHPMGVDDMPGIIEFILDWTAPEALDVTSTISVYGLSSSGMGTGNSSAGFVEVQVTTRCPRYWPDADGDGWGAGDVEDYIETCDAPPEGYAPNHGDCDDENPDIHPGQLELCNGIDDNCNGEVDEPRFDPPPMCERPGEICWAGVCQAAPGLDGGTDGGEDAGNPPPDAGGDGGVRPDGGEYVVPDTEILIVSGGCSATGIGALPLALAILIGLSWRSRHRRDD